jgi:hypothetical protein
MRAGEINIFQPSIVLLFEMLAGAGYGFVILILHA